MTLANGAVLALQSISGRLLLYLQPNTFLICHVINVFVKGCIVYLCDQVENSQERKNLVNILNNSGNSALHWAAMNGHSDAACKLLDLGADSALLNANGRTAVGEANAQDRIEFCRVLIDRYTNEQSQSQLSASMEQEINE